MKVVPYTVLFVGCGNIAGNFDELRAAEAPPLTHAGAFARHGGFALSACLDRDTRRAVQFANHWGVRSVVSTFDELLPKAGEFDVVSICSPTPCHADHVDRALALRPRVIFCEKPLTASLSDSVRLINACTAQGVALAVNYTRRWDSFLSSVGTKLRMGRWGEIRSVVGFYNKGILNNGGHMLDLLILLLGPLEVVAATSQRFDLGPDDPTVAALLRSVDGGVPVSLCPGDARDYALFELEIICSKGTLRMKAGGMSWEIREAGPSVDFAGYRSLHTSTELAGGYQEAMTNAAENIYAFLSRGEPLASTGDGACQVQQICAHILSSATNSA